VGVVILNWRRPREILETLQSLEQSLFRPTDVIVVDNGSANGSIAAIRKGFPSVRIVENGRNLGFAEGNNVGFRLLLADGIDYVFLLNDDTEIAPDLLGTLVATAEADPTIGMVGPTIYYFEPGDTVWCAGGEVSRIGEPRHLTADPAFGHSPRDVDYVSGCGMLVRRSVLDSTGLLDSRFFAYFEETEWCARARRAGFRVVHDPGSRMWHKIPSADRSTSPTYVYLMIRNRLLYLRCVAASPWDQARAASSMLRGFARRALDRKEPVFPRAVFAAFLHAAIGRYGAPPTWI
jgi:GT2 family glycosyltransferase